MSGRDAFRPGGDDDATRILVNPGGRLDRPEAGRPASPRERPEALAGGAGETIGPTPLVAAAGRLLMLASALQTAGPEADYLALRERATRELEQFVARGRLLGVADANLKLGHYALCALIDDLVLSTPWAARTGWASHSLVAQHHNEVVAGDRMLQLADQIVQDPRGRTDLLQLLYLCFSLGFGGRLRIDPRGRATLGEVRERLFNAARADQGVDLSTQWRGIETRKAPVRALMPLWVWWATALGLMALLFAVLSFHLSDRAGRLVKEIIAASPGRPAPIVRNVEAPPAPPSTLYATVRNILQPDIDAGRVEVLDEPQSVRVRLVSDGLFASGSADLSTNIADTIGRLSRAVGQAPGAIRIVGHSDNQPISGRTLRFADNWALSKARAEAVQTALGTEAAQAVIEGAGDTQPIASNDDPADQARNRRVEVTLDKPAPWQTPLAERAR